MKTKATLKRTAMTRDGKIARLPLVIRQRLNQRLQHGKLAQDLLAQSPPEVQAILAAPPNLIELN
jgi:hypothetical protein